MQESRPRNCVVCNTSKSKLTKVFGNFEDTHLCSKCRNGHYRSAKVFFSKIIHNFDHSTLSQEQFNDFSFKYLNEPSNCKLNQDLSDFEQICVMKNEFSNSKQCQFCRFRRTFFIFKIPALALFTEKKNNDSGENNDQRKKVFFGLKFREAIERLWKPMLDFLCGRIANVEYKHEVQKTKSRYRLAKQKYQKLRNPEVEIKNEVPGKRKSLQIQAMQISTKHISPMQISPMQVSHMQIQSKQILPMQFSPPQISPTLIHPLYSQPLWSQPLQTHHHPLQINPLQTQPFLQSSVVNSMQREASSFLFQPQYKLVETYCENLKTQDDYYIYFNNVHPSIYKKFTGNHVVKQEEGIGFDRQFRTTHRNMRVRTFFISIVKQLMQEVLRTYTQNTPNPVNFTDEEITKIAGEIVKHSGLHLNCMRVYCSIYPPTGDDHIRRVHFSNLSPKVKKQVSADKLQASHVAPDTYSFSLSTYYYYISMYILNSGATIEKANTCYQHHSNLSTAFSSLELFQQFIVYLKMLMQNSFEIDFKKLISESDETANENKNVEINVETGTLFDNETENESSLDEKNTVIASVMKQLDQCAHYYAVKFDVMKVMDSYNEMAENKEINAVFWQTVTADAENYGVGSSDNPVIRDGVLFNKYSSF